MSESGRAGLWAATDTLGLGLGTLLFPLLSLYLGTRIVLQLTHPFQRAPVTQSGTFSVHLPGPTVNGGQAGIELFMGVGAL